MINDNCNRRDLTIGKIDMMKGFSFFEVDKKFESLVLQSFKSAKYENVALSVQVSKPDVKTSGTSNEKGSYVKRDKDKRGGKRKRA
ncbi:MAG: hypothetical protein HC896_18240 [Bacteroidales bacterium]|nr:hypothetical protein [Bacteroidales bacterium]